MRLYRMAIRIMMVVVIGGAQWAIAGARATAEGAPAPQLVISQFKVTTNDGQYFTIYNPSSTAEVNLSGYELQYFNNNDLTKATSSKILPLSGTLPPLSYYMLSDGASTICYQITVNTASLGFSTTAGFAEILQLPQQAAAGSLVVPTVVDYVGWSKKTSGGNDVLSVSPSAASVTVQSGTSVSWMRQLPVQSVATSTWLPVRPDPKNACALQLVQPGSAPTQPVNNPGNQLATGQQPPATIVNLASSESGADTDVAKLPAADVGLAAPQLTELLPNPTGSGNDDSDEFIELYNPNTAVFDLSGFVLQTGTTTKHTYEFPEGTVLLPQSFTAFYSADTGLSLSNTSGRADLLDPFGNAVSGTDVYSGAKDGQTWSLANSKWYWTTEATPNAANVIKQPVVTTKAKSSSKTSKASGTTASASSTSGVVKGASTSSAGGSTSAAADTKTTPIHPLVLAAIAVLAVGYGIYEYRHDIANKLYELRRNRKLGRAARV